MIEEERSLASSDYYAIKGFSFSKNLQIVFIRTN